jgi:DNA-binding transcriptional LysR family regulator
VRLTDAALVLVEHAGALLERAELAQADLAAAAGTVAGSGAASVRCGMVSS